MIRVVQTSKAQIPRLALFQLKIKSTKMMSKRLLSLTLKIGINKIKAILVLLHEFVIPIIGSIVYVRRSECGTVDSWDLAVLLGQ